MFLKGYFIKTYLSHNFRAEHKIQFKMATIAAADPQATTTQTGDSRNIIFTTKHKRWQGIKICVIALLTILCIVFVIADVVITAKNVKKHQELKEYIQTRLEVSSAINSLQDIRDKTALHLISLLTNMTGLNQLKHEHHPWKFNLPAKNGTDIKDFESIMKAIHRLRSLKRNDTDYNRLLKDFKLYTTRIHVFISWLVNDSQNHDETNHLAAYDMIVKSREEFEMEKVLGTYCYFGANLTFQTVSQRRVRGEAFLETARLLSLAVNDNYLSLQNEKNTSLWLGKLDTKRQNLSLNASNKSDAYEWFNLTSKYCDLLIHLESKEAERISINIKKRIKENTMFLILRSVLVSAVLIILPFFIISLVRVQNEFYKYAQSLHHEVDLEQSRTEFLLRENARHMEGEYISLRSQYIIL